jgi:hypothetical protein
VTEPAVSAFGITKMFEIVNRLEHNVFHPLHNKLRDALTAPDLERIDGIGVDKKHFEFAAIPTIDETRRVETGHPML